MTEKQKAITIPLYNAQGKEIEKLKCDKDLFTDAVNKKLLAQVMVMYQANQRRGTASTKVRSEVRGSGKKPWRQKGTGRARVRDIRNPIWRTGGIVFGPHPKDFGYTLPKKMLKGALLSGLNSKLKDGKFLVVEDVVIAEPKTKEFKAILDKLKLKKKTLFVIENPTDAVKKSCRNLKDLTLRNASNLNALDVLMNDSVLFTKNALDTFKKRFTG
jgi:large subunit ribosomal protein L4